jgi:hypothetical protein
MLVGISGRAGSGKDTVGIIIAMIKEYYSDEEILRAIKYEKLPKACDYEIRKYADKLKDMVCMLLSCTRERLEDRKYKEMVLSSHWDKEVWKITTQNNVLGTYNFKEDAVIDFEHFAEYYTEDVVELQSEKVSMTPRLLLQLLGTDCGRDIIHPNIWVNSLMGEYDSLVPTRIKDPNWIITDVRFPNEAEAIKKRGGLLIRVNRQLPKDSYISEHSSENSLDDYVFDLVLENNKDILYLISQLRELVKNKL